MGNRNLENKHPILPFLVHLFAPRLSVEARLLRTKTHFQQKWPIAWLLFTTNHLYLLEKTISHSPRQKIQSQGESRFNTSLSVENTFYFAAHNNLNKSSIRKKFSTYLAESDQEEH